MPKISVIVPIYNVEQYIEQCINSLTQQTMKAIEIICVDDCGTDNSIKIAEKLAKTDKRIKIVHNEQNCGLSESRNNGIRHATAPYIMFCDSDDWFANDMCEKMYNAITADDADLAICGTDVIYEADHDMKAGDDVYFAVHHTGTMDLTQEIKDQHSVCAWNKIYKHSIIAEHDVQFPRGLKYEDNYFYHAYCLWVNRAAFLQEKLYKYRRRAGSIMNSTYGNKTLNLHPLHIAIAWYDYAKKHEQLHRNLNWFWGKFFFELVRNTLDYSSVENHGKCYDAANKFISDNLKASALDYVASRNIAQIVHRTIKPRRLLGGLIKIQTSDNETFLRAFGIKLWKIKHNALEKKYYFLGLRFF